MFFTRIKEFIRIHFPAIMAMLTLGLAYFFIAFEVKLGFGGGDNYQHFIIAKYALKHPMLFLNHWGKPIYTLLFCLVSQGPYFLAMVFNILLAFSTAWTAYRLCGDLGIKSAWTVIPLTLLAPMYIYCSVSVLTEILFSLVAVYSVFAFARRNYIFSALLFSLLPLIRTEGVFLLPILMFSFLMVRQYFPILLLFTGILVFSIVGLFVFNDFFWLYSQMPYGNVKEVYGTGNLFDFYNRIDEILSYSIGVFTVAGIIIWLFRNDWRVILTRNEKVLHHFLIFFIVSSCFVLYFSMHSYAWTRGDSGSVGLIRVIAAVSPFAAIMAAVFFDWISRNVVKNSFLQITVFSIFFIWLGYEYMFVRIDPEKEFEKEYLLMTSLEWIKEKKLHEDVVVHYFDPLVAFILDIDPFVGVACKQVIWERNKPELMRKLKDNDLLIWDGHFSPNEGGSPLRYSLFDPECELLKRFYPEKPVSSMNHIFYEVFIFKKNSTIGNKMITTNYTPNEMSSDSIKFLKDEFMPIFRDSLSNLPTNVAIMDIKFLAADFIELDQSGLQLVYEVRTKDEKFLYMNVPFRSIQRDVQMSWTGFQNEFTIPPTTEIRGELIVYIWNMNFEQIKLKGLDVTISTTE